MQKLPILGSIWNYVSAPALPQTSLEITETHLALISLRYRGGEFEPRNLGVMRLPAGFVNVSFTEPNIAHEAPFVEQLAKTAAQSGLSRIKTLSVSLPAGSARSLVVSLDEDPGSRAELAQMIEWKTERNLGHKFADLRVSYKRLRDFKGRPQWLISAIHNRVIEQYERIFDGIGWKAGLIVPQHIGEAQWLMRSGIEEDQVVLSLNNRGFDAVIVRGDEPLLVREVTCAPADREDEFFRLMIFYRDRLISGEGPVSVNRMLTIGTPAEQRRYKDVLSTALERNTLSLDAQQLGLKTDPNAPFNLFAAAGGLATMAWS